MLQNKKKFAIAIYICIVLMFLSTSIVMALDTIGVEPTDNQYFELRAVEVKTVEGQNKQVIMELWGHYIEFKRTRCKIYL